MGWARFDDAYSDHPKIIAAGALAELLDVRAILYACRYETDGRIAKDVLSRISTGISQPRAKAAKLVEVGRWRVTADGWEIVDYLEYNPSREDREQVRAAARDRMSRAREQKRDSRDVRANSPRSAREVRVTPSPTPIENSSLQSLSGREIVHTRPVDNCPRCQGRGTYWNAGAGRDVNCECTRQEATA